MLYLGVKLRAAEISDRFSKFNAVYTYRKVMKLWLLSRTINFEECLKVAKRRKYLDMVIFQIMENIRCVTSSHFWLPTKSANRLKCWQPLKDGGKLHQIIHSDDSFMVWWEDMTFLICQRPYFSSDRRS